MIRLISRIVSLFLCLTLITGSLHATVPIQAHRRPSAYENTSLIVFQSQALGVRLAPYRERLNRRPTVAMIRRLLERIRFIKPEAQKELADSIRAEFFIQNDGVDFVTTPALLSRTGVLDLLRSKKTVPLSEVLEFLRKDHSRVNEGYVRVGLHLLAEQGWVKVKPQRNSSSLRYSLTRKGQFIVDHPDILPAYEKAADFIKTELSTVEDLEQNFPFVRQARAPPSLGHMSFEHWIREASAHHAFGIKDLKGREGKIVREIKTQLWGSLLGPTAAIFEFNGIFELYNHFSLVTSHMVMLQAAKNSNRSHIDPDRIENAFSLFVAAGVLEKKGEEGVERYLLTRRGRAFADLAGARGVPVSYLPMLAQLETLYFGEASRVFEFDANHDERHVARNLNLMGTRKAHKQHFKKMIPRLAALFDNDDFENQPRFIADMGCGDGSFLIEAYAYILKHTKRGKVIGQHPLWVIGADFNRKARETTLAHMQKAGIETFHVIEGDINDPAALAQELVRLGLDPLAGVHTSTFLMHNRPFLKPFSVNGKGKLRAGAYVVPHPDFADVGYYVSNSDLEQNFFEWMDRWKLLLERFGMFFIELHTAPPKSGAYAATSYLATHAYSGQYLLPMQYFLKLMKRAGMQLVWMLALPAQYAPKAPNGLYHYRAAARTAA